MAAPYKLTPDGFETQWQTNHLAPFYLTQLLLPLLTSTAQSTPSKTRVRIVNVSSVAALTGGMAPKTLNTTAPNLENVTGTLAAW
jgi:NAD(P)-dependent dehydrogenase (short-subunit alcohol dehydrogenase family)